MKKVLVGSKAMALHLGDKAMNLPLKDTDYLVDKKPIKNASGEDYILAPVILDSYDFIEDVASLDELLTLKISHSPWVITTLQEWGKHLKDIRLLQDNGATLIEELYSIAYKEWELKYGLKNVNLSKSKMDFFNKSVKRYYEHDSVHESIALAGLPAFNLILETGSEVKPSKEKFAKLSLEGKKRLVFEEVMVLSLERDLIPISMENKNSFITKEIIYRSYKKQLRLLMTQYSKGWFPRWIIENYFVVASPPLNYWDMFQDSSKKISLSVADLDKIDI